jgi:hypothetical protein
MLFTALQLPNTPPDRPLRSYTLHCPGHEELVTTELTLIRRDDEDDAVVLDRMLSTLRRQALAAGVWCRHEPKDWR